MYSISLNVNGKRCIVVGGGRVAERKIEGLLAAGACVTVISPQITERLRQLQAEKRIEALLRPYREGDLEGASLVFAATDSEAVNREVCREAQRRGLWVNDVGSPDRSTFHVPAVLSRGDLQVAVSTSGSGPMLASALRDELADIYGEQYEALLELFGRLRAHVRQLDIPEHVKWACYRQWVGQKEQIMRQLEDDRSDQGLETVMRKLLHDITRYDQALSGDGSAEEALS